MLYWYDYLINSKEWVYKIKCPGGAIKVFQTPTFMLSDDFYTIEEDVVYKLEVNGNNDLSKSFVCPSPASLDQRYDDYIGDNFGYNNIRNTYIFVNYEFNGTSIVKLQEPIPYEFWEDGVELCETNSAWYSHCNGKLYKLDKSNYGVTEIELSDYQLLEIASDITSSSLSFVAIRYSDSKKVIGKITSDNSFVIESEISSNQNIYNLIPLN